MKTTAQALVVKNVKKSGKLAVNGCRAHCIVGDSGHIWSNVEAKTEDLPQTYFCSIVRLHTYPDSVVFCGIQLNKK